MQIHMFKVLAENFMKLKQKGIGFFIEEDIYLLITEEKDLELGLDQLNLVLN